MLGRNRVRGKKDDYSCSMGLRLWPSAIAVLGILLFAGRLAVAQSPAGPITPPAPKAQPTLQTPKAAPTTPKIAVEAKLVYLYVTVRDKKGKLVPDLNEQDFVLEEDGRPETITHFMRDSDLALTLGLLVDTSLSQRNVLDDERSASYKFLDQMLREGKDEAFVIHFDREVELLQDLTASRPKLNAALQQLQTPQPQLENANGGNNGNDGGGGGTNTTDPDENVPPTTTSGGGRQRGDSGGGTLLYDAIYLASKEEMSKQQGRKAIFVLSDGVDRGSKETLTAAIEAAQRSDTSVYSIFFADNNSNDNGSGRHGGWGHGGGWPGGGWPGGGGGHRYPQQQSRTDGKEILKRISAETGGQLFQVSKKLPLDQIFAQAEEQLRSQYSLGYTPDHKDSGAGYHKIALTTKTKDQSVQVRDGYYSDN
jgi:VWFA-related protein